MAQKPKVPIGAKPRTCPICKKVVTKPLTLEQWRKAWMSHKLSSEHVKELWKATVVRVAIDCGGDGCLEIIVVPWHDERLKHFDKVSGTWQVDCASCGHSNTVKDPLPRRELPLGVLWKSYPAKCESQFGPLEFRTSLHRSAE